MSQKALASNQVSIVIPAYNEEGHLRACLDSIAAQTLLPLEVIVVDNNCTDKTVGIAKIYPFVRVVAEKKQGILYARDAGFNAARGEIIGRLDADTVLPSDWVSMVADFLDKNPDVAAVTGDNYFYNLPLRRIVRTLHAFVYYDLQGLVVGVPVLWGSNMAIRAAAWDKVRDMQVSVKSHEDIDLTLKMQKMGMKIAYSKKIRAEVSLRHGNFGTKATAKYLLGAPRTYWHNARYLAAFVFGGILLVSYVLLLPFMLGYDFVRLVRFLLGAS